MLVSVKTSPLQVVQGRLFGMSQSQAHPWLHVLLVVLRAALRALGDAPARSVAALAQLLEVAEAEAADPPLAPAPLPTAVPTPVPTSPLVGTMGPHGASRVPRIRLRRRAVIAGRTQATP